MKRKIGLVLAILAMAIEVTACGSTSNQTANTQTANTQTPDDPGTPVKTMKVKSFDIEYSYMALTKYQSELLEKNDYYIDYLEELDSPTFVFIGPAGKSLYRHIVDITADDSQNVTITVGESNPDMPNATQYPLISVRIYPACASVTVVNEDGKELQLNN